MIEQAVLDDPGLTFTQIKDRTGMANGVIQYHLQRSERVEKRKGAYVPVGYCNDCDLQPVCGTYCALRILRDPMKRTIIAGLVDGKTQDELAAELRKDKSTISYHVQRLTDQGMIEETKPVSEVQKVLTDTDFD